MSLIKKVIAALLGVAILAVSTLYYISKRDLLGGKTYLKNATRAFEKVDIREEGDLGIKYIEAETFLGAVYGLGAVHARDRLWQLYFFRLVSQGRISEVSYSFIELLLVCWQQHP